MRFVLCGVLLVSWLTFAQAQSRFDGSAMMPKLYTQQNPAQETTAPNGCSYNGQL
jgi:hypothetical protein